MLSDWGQSNGRCRKSYLTQSVGLHQSSFRINRRKAAAGIPIPESGQSPRGTPAPMLPYKRCKSGHAKTQSFACFIALGVIQSDNQYHRLSYLDKLPSAEWNR